MELSCFNAAVTLYSTTCFVHINGDDFLLFRLNVFYIIVIIQNVILGFIFLLQECFPNPKQSSVVLGGDTSMYLKIISWC